MEKSQLEIALMLALLTGIAGQASAGQKPANARPGQEVVVTQSAPGEELRGRLVELSPTSVAILVDNRRVNVPIENVLRIDARDDSLKNGAIIGGVTMLALSGLACPFTDKASRCVTGIVVNTGLGILAGAGIDALHKGRTPIYIKAGKSGSALQVQLRF
jgi:hypothetical protein